MMSLNLRRSARLYSYNFVEGHLRAILPLPAFVSISFDQLELHSETVSSLSAEECEKDLGTALAGRCCRYAARTLHMLTVKGTT